MSLFIHPDSQRTLDAVMNDGTHAIILSGKDGIGLATIAANAIKGSKKLYNAVLPEKDEKVDLEKGTITVQSIRRLYELTKTIEPNGRVIVIDYAERMGMSAQNAFLKLLEEPVEGTQFLLLTHQVSSLLPTVLSRSQHVALKPVSLAQSNELLDELKVTNATKRAQLLFIASGLPAELTRLANDETYFSNRVQIVKDAREFISSSLYARLLIANKYKNNRAGALVLLEDSSRLLRKTLADGGTQSTLSALSRVEVIHKRLSEQGNVRLQLSSALIL